MTVLPLGDDELLGRLRTIAAVADPVPEELYALSRSAIGRVGDDELADLLFDSLQDDIPGIRGTACRQLTFGVDDLTIELDVDSDGLVGFLNLAGPATVEIHTAKGVTGTEADELGRFFVDPVPARRFRLRVATPGRWVTTEWVQL